jgi:hypothetical protein
MVSFTPLSLYLRCPLDRRLRLGGPQNRSGCCWECQYRDFKLEQYVPLFSVTRVENIYLLVTVAEHKIDLTNGGAGDRGADPQSSRKAEVELQYHWLVKA